MNASLPTKDTKFHEGIREPDLIGKRGPRLEDSVASKKGVRAFLLRAGALALLGSLSLEAQDNLLPGALQGREGLVAEPVLGEGLPTRLMGVGISDQGVVYVTETVRQSEEEVSLLRSRFLHAIDMGMTTVAEKRAWIERNYSPQIAEAQQMKDVNEDGKIDLADLVIRSEKIHTFQDRDGDGVYDEATLFADGFNDIVSGVAHSVTPIGDDVYATVIPDLWKLSDSDGDGRADRRTQLVHGFAPHIGYGNHDLHSVVQGYDGKLYWSMGDRGVNAVSQEGQRFAYPHTGTIVRCNPDGSEFEVFASGLRNCQYFDFDNYGNLFSVDHDADFQGEQERLVYLPEGSDSGWRCYYQYREDNRVLQTGGESRYSPWLSEEMWKPFHPGQPSHILPPIENSWDAPASFSFQPGLALGGAYRDHFLLGGRGMIRAFKMLPDGASFKRGQEDVVVRGLISQVLSSAFSPDGRLFFTLWAPRRDVSTLWTLRPSEPPPAAAVAVQGMLSGRLRDRSASELLDLLGHADRRVRMAAQFALVDHREAERLETLARNESAALIPRLHSLWALGQLKHKDAALLARLCSSESDEMRAQAARWAGDLGFDPEGRLIPLLRDPSPRVRMLTAIACGKLGSEGALEPLVDLLVEANNAVPVLRHAGVAGLTGVATLKELEGFASHPSEALRIAAVVALRQRGGAGALMAFLDDPSAQVQADAVRALYDAAMPETFQEHPEALEALAAMLRPELDSAVTIRALAANRRLGTRTAARRVAAFLEDSRLDRLERLQALNTLEHWTSSSPLDPVDGRYFPVSACRSDTLEVAFGEGLWNLSKDPDPVIAQKAIALLARLKPSEERLREVAENVLDAGENEASRVEWLRWLRLQDSGRFLQTGLTALSDASPLLRRSAAEELILAQAAEEQVEAYLVSTLRQRSDYREVQYALSRLPTISSPERLLLPYLDDLLSGRLMQALHLDTIEAAERMAGRSPAAQERLVRYRERLQDRGPLSRYEAALEGGDPKKGETLFLGHAEAACSQCHALRQADRQLGPSLEGIASRQPRSYLLESIIDPQAQAQAGYSSVTLTLRRGGVIAGLLQKEGSEGITLRLPDGSEKTYSRADILSQSQPVSMMPDLSGVLSLREVRDIVAYLATLR